MTIKKFLKTVFSLIICLIFTTLFSTQPVYAATVTNLVDFNNTSDLTDLFNPSTDPTFTNIGGSGISDSGAIDVPLGSNEIWTTKQGYSVSGAGDVYTFSAFFKIKDNSGYGSLGFSNQDTNETDDIGAPATGIGMVFHGGGGVFTNNRTYTSAGVGWVPNLVLGNWYKMIFVVTAKGSNTYDLKFQIWNSDSNGNLDTIKTEQTLNGVVNADLGGASTIHGYFSAAGSRMEKIDNFLIQLEGGASFVESGLPVVLTDSITNITSNSATSGGNVTDGQGGQVDGRGVCWSTSPSPALGVDSSSFVRVGSGLGTYTGGLTGLTPSTTYYVRAYAFSSSGTSYGSEYSFTTSAASVDTTSSNNNSSSSTTTDLSCHDSPPVLTPDLFQINTTTKTAKLFFTPIDTNQFFISFSTNPNAEENGEQVSLLREGVQSETINFLKPNTTYYFKVRGQNGCTPGDWSNIMKIKTGNSIFYKNSSSVKTLTTSISKPSTIAKSSKSNSVLLNTPTPIISQTPQSSTPTETKSKKCLLWWCW